MHKQRYSVFPVCKFFFLLLFIFYLEGKSTFILLWEYLLSKCQNSCPRQLNIIKNVWFQDFFKFPVKDSQYSTKKSTEKFNTVRSTQYSTVQQYSIPMSTFLQQLLRATSDTWREWQMVCLLYCALHTSYTLPCTALHTLLLWPTLPYIATRLPTLPYIPLRFLKLSNSSKHFPSLPYNSIHFPTAL